MWCIDNYISLVAGILFVILLGRWHWYENKAFHENEEWRELCRLRERYKPGLNEELVERKRLVELEKKWNK